MSVSKSKVKELSKALDGALVAQQVIVRKAKAILALRQLFNDSTQDLVAQIDVVGRRLGAIKTELDKALEDPKKKEKEAPDGPK